MSHASVNSPYQEHQFKLSLHKPHNFEKSYMPLFYPFKSTNQSLLPYTLPQYFSPFGINLQKGSPPKGRNNGREVRAGGR